MVDGGGRWRWVGLSWFGIVSVLGLWSVCGGSPICVGF